MQIAKNSMPYPYLDTKNVFTCGWTNSSTAGCWSYLVTRPEGNVMIDTPRYNPSLAKRIEEMGGIKFMLLTHKDDVGDHKKWAEHFGATRVLHRNEITDGTGWYQDTTDVEIKLTGKGPYNVEGLDDFEIIYQPGHTDYHLVFYYKPEKTLFTGDHLGRSQHENELAMSLDFNWFDPKLQFKSI